MDEELFAPCPPDCEVPADIHRHYQRKAGAYFELATPMICCGRKWARPDEIVVLDQCEFCFVDRKPLPGSILLPPWGALPGRPRLRRSA